MASRTNKDTGDDDKLDVTGKLTNYDMAFRSDEFSRDFDEQDVTEKITNYDIDKPGVDVEESIDFNSLGNDYNSHIWKLNDFAAKTDGGTSAVSFGDLDNQSLRSLTRRIQMLERTSCLRTSTLNGSIAGTMNKTGRIRRSSIQRPSIWNRNRTSIKEEGESSRNSTYPEDCYSMIALNGPGKNLKWSSRQSFLFFMFGFTVFLFQILLLSLTLYSGVDRKRGTIQENDNPDTGFFAAFIPPNAKPIVRVTQILSLMVFCLFPEASLQDVVTSIQLFPWTNAGKKTAPLWSLRFTCCLRLSQGIVAIAAVWLLVMSSDTVIDIILNFTAVNFISSLDDNAFSLAESGVFGPLIMEETSRVAGTKLPFCVDREKKHVWYRRVMGGTLLISFALVTYVIIRQELPGYWVTDTLRVEFTEKEFKQYSGCFHLNERATRKHQRYIYNSHDKESNTTFGYCRESRQWILFDDNDGTFDPCSARKNGFDRVRSSKTDSFDISTSFEEPWDSSVGAPLKLFFFDNTLPEEELHCDLVFGDGSCDEEFNYPGYSYDEGDCCAATCSLSNCGVGSQETIFGSSVYSQVNFPYCEDPDMVPITIQLNDIKSSRHEDFLEIDDHDWTTFREQTPVNPYFALQCDDMPVLTTYIEQIMVNNEQTVMVKDGSTCVLEVRNNTSSNEPIPMLDDPIWLVDYTIFHGKKETSTKTEGLVEILSEHSKERAIVRFKRIPECYFRKLQDFIEIESIYPAVGQRNKAIDWLVQNDTENSQCEDQQFIERYAGTKIIFALEKTQFLSTSHQCTWSPVMCSEGSITTINMKGDWGANATVGLPSEIGLLKNLNKLEIGRNLITSIPTEIGTLTNLKTLVLNENQIVSIPTEIGLLTDLKYINLGTNRISSIPSEIGLLTSLTSLKIFSNQITEIPSEIFQLTRLSDFWLFDNKLTFIPNDIAQLTNLKYLNMRTNSIASIPSSIGQLTLLEYLNLSVNQIVVIPNEIGSLLGSNLYELQLGENPIETFPDALGYLNVEPYPFDEGTVFCQNVPDFGQYCDCGGDCRNFPSFCQCEEAQAITCCGGYFSSETDFRYTCEEEAGAEIFQYFLDDADTDNSTSIDLNEYMNYWAENNWGNWTEKEIEEDALAYFLYHDINGNGSIDAEEYGYVWCNPPTESPTVTFSPTQSSSPTFSPTQSLSPTQSSSPTYSPTDTLSPFWNWLEDDDSPNGDDDDDNDNGDDDDSSKDAACSAESCSSGNFCNFDDGGGSCEECPESTEDCSDLGVPSLGIADCEAVCPSAGGGDDDNGDDGGRLDEEDDDSLLIRSED